MHGVGDPLYGIFYLNLGEEGEVIILSINLHISLKKTKKLLFRNAETGFQNAEIRFQNAEIRFQNAETRFENAETP